MDKIMANITVEGEHEPEPIQPYGMHVSSRYLELTKRKLQLTRLPREIQLPDHRRWEYGTPKAVLEPLIDFWLDQYDWRIQESLFNNALPQFRTVVHFPLPAPIARENHQPEDEENQAEQATPSTQSLRVHFVHKRSKHSNAIPLLFCHSWPSSFIELYKIIDALTDPVSLPSYGSGAQQAFHVVAPSIPGFGFSDASPAEKFGLKETADAFHEVMVRLGYENRGGKSGGYVVHGAGWGFKICRALALYHPQHCLAIHTTNPSFQPPTLTRSPVSYFKYNMARLTRARVSFLSFGYTPSDFLHDHSWSSQQERGLQEIMHGWDSSEASLASQYSHRPQTSAYSLCDSPIGLLACILDAVHSRSIPTSPHSSRSRSPFMSPAELSQQESQQGEEVEMQIQPIQETQTPLSPHESETNGPRYTWTPTEVLSWTMMQWLPGPEAGLRWLRQASVDSSPSSYLERTYSSVPLGISQFRSRTESGATSPLMWAEAVNRLQWVKRHQRSARWPTWEAPDLLVLDLRECFGSMLERGVVLLPREAEMGD